MEKQLKQKLTLKNKNQLILEDGSIIYLTKDMIKRFELDKKDELSNEEFKQLIYIRMRLTATNMLSKRDYFYKEFIDTLTRKIGFRNYAENIAEEFKKKGFLDDYEAAVSYIEMHKNYGSKKLAFMLSHMNVDKLTIDELLTENEDSEIEHIKKLILSMQHKPEDKQITSLIRRGFPYGNIKKAIKLIKEEEDI